MILWLESTLGCLLCHFLCHCNTMNPSETHPDKPSKAPKKKFNFTKVKDNRGREIRGLWERNGRYYARLAVVNPKTGKKSTSRIPLEDVKTVAQARNALEDLKKERREGELRVVGQTPYLKDFVETYFSTVQGKRPSTLRRERGSLNAWTSYMGTVRLSDITPKHIHGFISYRKSQGLTNRTVNLDLITITQVLKKAQDFHHIRSLPTENVRQLRHVAVRRSLITLKDIRQLCDAALEESKNGVQFSDYIHFMAFAGSRRNETLRVKWSDVNFERKTVTIGSDGNTKNHESRVVNFNANLDDLLQQMLTRKAPDSDWLFPSPRRGDKDAPVIDFRGSLDIARAKSGLDINFHDLRHYFISTCVMAGIDYMTIARWAGHKDGGILIGRVYGHLSDDHARQQAARVVF